MKKILAIAPYPYLPFFSGGQKFIAKFFEYLGKKTDLTVISTVENKTGLAKTYKAVPLLKKSFSRYFDFSLVKKISDEVKANKYDTIIWEHPYYSWLAFRVRKRTGVRTIIHTHNIEYQRFRSMGKWWWPILKSYERSCFRKADNILFITPEDRNFAINEWRIDPGKCLDLPFGIDISQYPGDRSTSRQIIKTRHGIADDEKILFFNGLLDYKPNLDALRLILDTINPILLLHPSFRYKIIICGTRLPAELDSLKAYADKNIIYAGFTEEIGEYYKAADVFLNPVESGGGIKTKMVEAIAYGNTVVATPAGATGIERTVCGDKLIVIDNKDWKAFSNAIMRAGSDSSRTPDGYYGYYYWENVVGRLLAKV